MGVGGEEFAHEVEDGAVEDDESGFDGFYSNGLGEVAFADSGRADEEDVAAFPHEVGGGELVDLGAVDAGVEAEVEVLEGALFPKGGALLTPGQEPLVADVEFVLEEKFEELGMREAVGFGFLEAKFEAAKQAGEA